MDDGSGPGGLVMLLSATSIAIFVWMVLPALNSRRWPFAADLSVNGLIWGALGIGVLALLFSPRLIPIIIVAVAFHEYGHVLAYRLAGHRAPKFRLAPFGGVAMSEEPPRNQAENAYVALMGPGFSVALLVAALLTAEILRGDASWAEVFRRLELVARGEADASIVPWGAVYASEAALLIAILNLLNLFPFFPLDGGRVVHAAALTAGPRLAQAIALLASALLAAAAFMIGSMILGLLALLGLLFALRAQELDRNTPRMSLTVTVLALAAYAATTAAHAYVAWPWLEAMARRATAF